MVKQPRFRLRKKRKKDFKNQVAVSEVLISRKDISHKETLYLESTVATLRLCEKIFKILLRQLFYCTNLNLQYEDFLLVNWKSK